MPSVGNSYEALNGALLRSPNSSTNQPFTGDSLQLDAGAYTRLKGDGQSDASIEADTDFYSFGSNGLILSGGNLANGDDVIAVISGPVSVVADSFIWAAQDGLTANSLSSGAASGVRAYIFTGPLSGTNNLTLGNAIMAFNADGTSEPPATNYANFVFANSNNAYQGNMTVTAGWLQAGAPGALGASNTITIAGGAGTNGVDGPAQFDATVPFNDFAATLVIQDANSVLLLDNNMSFAAASIDGVALTKGNSYTASQINALTTNKNVVDPSGTNTLTIGAAVTTAPALVNLPVSNVQGTSATLNGRIISTGNEVPNVTIYYGTSDGGTNPAAWTKSVGLGTQGGSFSYTAFNLLTNTTYYYTAQAANSEGTVFATPSQSFVTQTPEATSQIQYLSGTDKDNTVQWNFMVTSGRLAGVATNIAVPSCWETQGFGTYNYGNNGSVSNSETGIYGYTFSVPSAWAGRKIFLVFEGVFTDTSVTVNGQSVGPTHQGGFYEFKYDVTANVVPGAATNVLRVTARRWSQNASIVKAEEKGDFWDFSGIFRPVYLQANPAAYIDRVAVNPQANGQITVNAYLGDAYANYSVNAFVTDSNNVQLGAAFSAPVASGSSNIFLSANLPQPNTWSAEFPNLYTLTVQLLDTNNQVVHTLTNQIGFRTITFVSGQGYFINGKKVVLRGICHHEEWPTTGRTSSLGQSDLDLALIKDMNLDAIRMTHYPPSKGFMDECDRLGIYVYDELTGWEAAYDNSVASNLVKELVVRDVNHPCIIAWDNGNESGWNTTVDNNGTGATNVYAIWDPQNRHINRPQSTFNNVKDDHYPSYSGFTGSLGSGKMAYSCTEVLHGLYDGAGGASLQEFWDAMRTAPNGIGMFEWVFADSGQIRTDQGGIMDVKGQSAPDGVMGPFREKEASYYTYKAVYSPVQVGAPSLTSFNGTLAISNRFDFTDLSQCTFDWQLGALPGANDSASAFSTNALTGGFLVSVDSGAFAGPALAPQTTGTISLKAFPGAWTNYDALRLTATDPFGRNIYTWTWPLRSVTQIRDRIVGTPTQGAPAISAINNGSEIIVTNGPRIFHFNGSSGVLNSLTVSNQAVSFANGPRPADGTVWTVSSITNYFDGTNYIVLVNDITSAANGFQWTLRSDGWLKLSYRYTSTGLQNWMGITFDYPSNKVTAMNWVGQGPYRVYKNRLRGQEIFGHTKAFNYTWTGQSTNYAAQVGLPTTSQWNYPEFEGYHGQLYWATLQTTERPITVATATSNLFFRLLTPPNTDNANVNVAYPSGTLSFLNGITPIGEKFNTAGNLGPAGQMNTATGLYTGELDFFFGNITSVPAPPAQLTASVGPGQSVLNWSAVSGATGYNLKVSTVAGGPYVMVGSNLTSLSFTNSGLLNGTIYYYVVTALNANGESENSPQASVVTPVLSPVIGHVSNSGSALVFTGNNGIPGMGYLVLMTTNLLLPVIRWQILATNLFDSSGGFNFTNSVNSSNATQFYMLRIQ